ncbi:MAG: hypothetical protein SangKO_036740 [Sandaracinaceae bacterium]
MPWGGRRGRIGLSSGCFLLVRRYETPGAKGALAPFRIRAASGLVRDPGLAFAPVGEKAPRLRFDTPSGALERAPVRRAAARDGGTHDVAGEAEVGRRVHGGR